MKAVTAKRCLQGCNGNNRLVPNDSVEVRWFGVCADAKARLKWNDVKRKFSGCRNIANWKFLPRSNIPVICWLRSLPLWWMSFLSFNSNINTTAALTTMQDVTENVKHYSYSVCFVILNVATTVWKSLRCSFCSLLAVHRFQCVRYRYSEDCSRQTALCHGAPPRRLAVSIVRRHKNPQARFLIEPTLQVHLHSFNLPNAFSLFCSNLCFLQPEMHNISIMGNERHSPPLFATAWQNTERIPGSGFQRAQVNYGNVLCRLLSFSHINVCSSLSALWLLTRSS